MWNRLLFLVNRLKERLWVRPLFLCLMSVAAAFVAKAADYLDFDGRVPSIASDSIETLLAITAGSMLVIATLAVTSMVSAYASASSKATPRSFSLLVADDLSQNALSTFLGAFIFTFVALVALKNGFYDKTGLFALFVMTIAVVALVILTFVRWVDWIARLGRIGTTVDKIESAGAAAFSRSRLNSRLGGAETEPDLDKGDPVHTDTIGYVQHVNVETLQEIAAQHDIRISMNVIPGGFVAPDRPLAFLHWDGASPSSIESSNISAAFEIGSNRVFDDDPRFALVALSEIACKALSPAVNDPGTAISIFGSFVRLFSIFAEPLTEDENPGVQFDRVLVPAISADDMLEDAFRGIARDGAGIVEVQIRLQKALQAIAAMPEARLVQAAKKQSQSALKRAEKAIEFEADLTLVHAAAAWSR